MLRSLTLTRPLVYFDLETTGTDRKTDRIVEIYACKEHPDGHEDCLHHVINPGIPIPSGASAVHGFTDKDVADKPAFCEVAAEICAFFTGADVAGFNVRRFDLPMLMEEFHRCKLYPVLLTQTKVVDAMNIYHQRERRDLSGAVQFYCNRTHEGAHSAEADVRATIDILKAQLLRYADLEAHPDELHRQSNTYNAVDFSGKFALDADGDTIFSFGKHQGEKVSAKHENYLTWMLKEGDFPVDTQMAIKLVRQSIRKGEKV